MPENAPQGVQRMVESKWSRAWEEAKPEEHWKRRGAETVIGAGLGGLVAQTNGWKIGLLGGLIGAIGGAALPIIGAYLLSLFRDGRKQAQAESELLKVGIAEERAATSERDATILSRDDEIAKLRAERLAPDHEEAIRQTLKELRFQLLESQPLNIGSQGSSGFT